MTAQVDIQSLRIGFSNDHIWKLKTTYHSRRPDKQEPLPGTSPRPSSAPTRPPSAPPQGVRPAPQLRMAVMLPASPPQQQRPASARARLSSAPRQAAAQHALAPPFRPALASSCSSMSGLVTHLEDPKTVLQALLETDGAGLDLELAGLVCATASNSGPLASDDALLPRCLRSCSQPRGSALETRFHSLAPSRRSAASARAAASRRSAQRSSGAPCARASRSR